MSRRGRRVRQPRGPHKDKYATLAAQSQETRAAFEAEWVRNHPTPPPAAVTEMADDTEEEEVA